MGLSANILISIHQLDSSTCSVCRWPRFLSQKRLLLKSGWSMNQWLIMQGINSIPPPDHPLNTKHGKTQPVQVSCCDDATYYSGHQHSFRLQPLFWDHLGRPKLDNSVGSWSKRSASAEVHGSASRFRFPNTYTTSLPSRRVCKRLKIFPMWRPGPI